jgi:hypothetical protein
MSQSLPLMSGKTYGWIHATADSGGYRARDGLLTPTHDELRDFLLLTESTYWYLEFSELLGLL